MWYEQYLNRSITGETCSSTHIRTVCPYILYMDCIPGQKLAESSGEVLDIFRMRWGEKFAHELHGTHAKRLRLHHLGIDNACEHVCMEKALIVVAKGCQSLQSLSQYHCSRVRNVCIARPPITSYHLLTYGRDNPREKRWRNFMQLKYHHIYVLFKLC